MRHIIATLVFVLGFAAASMGQPLSVTRTLTHAEIAALPTTAIELVPAPGPGKVLLFWRGIIRGRFTADYCQVDANATAYVRYASFGTTHASHVMRVGDTLFFDASYGASEPLVGTFSPLSYNDWLFGATEYWPVAFLGNTGLVIEVSNAGLGATNFGCGDPANTVTVTVYYTVEDL